MATDPLVQKLVDGCDSWPGEDDSPLGGARMTQALYPYDSLFSPIQINKLRLKNRIVMAPMGNINMCEETGRPNDKMLEYFFARARGGAGLLTTGLVPVSHGIDPTVTEPGNLSYFPRLDRSRTVYPGWRDLAQGIHAFGSRLFIQLTAGLGRVGNPQCLLTRKRFPRSASLNPNFYMPAIPCLPLTDGRLKKIIKNTGQAAADAHAMGIDGVYLHGHEGYLIEQMTNPAFNRRKMGRYTDWKRFGLDLVEEIRRRVGADYPVMYRIDLSLALEESYGPDAMKNTHMKKFIGGRSVAQTLAYMEALVGAGVDIFDVDLGCYDNWWLPHPPSGMPAGCFLEVARAAKNHFEKKKIQSNAGLPVPIVGVGKLGYPDIAENALRKGDCDMVMLGRPLLADPDWPNKTYAGKVADIRPCIGCQEGCLNEFLEGGHPQCAVNPRTGFEHMLPEIPPKAENIRKIAVVGGGPAGIIAALTAAGRGHIVDLFEQGPRLGGRMVAGGVAKIKYDIENFREYLERLVYCAEKDGRLKLYLETTAGVSRLKGGCYDAAIFAVGTRDNRPALDGMNKEKMDAARTIDAAELFLSPEKLGDARDVVVIGGGTVGCEMAQWLSYEKGCAVTVVEMLPQLMAGICTANRAHLLHALRAKGVKLLACASVTALLPSSQRAVEVRLRRNTHPNLPDPYDAWSPILPENIRNPLAPKIGEEFREETLAADLVVLATGGRPDDRLFLEAQKAGCVPELYNIGDSFSPGKVQEAVRAAYRLGTTI